MTLQSPSWAKITFVRRSPAIFNHAIGSGRDLSSLNYDQTFLLARHEMIVDWTGWLFLPLEKFSHWTLKFLRFSNSWSWIFVCFMCIFTIYSFSRIFPLLLDVTASNQICRGGRVIFTILTENFRKRTDILRRPNGQRDCGMHVFCPKQAISKDVLISKEGRTKFLAISYNLRFLF